MPPRPLTRQEIVNIYYDEIHPNEGSHDVDPVLQDSMAQSTFGVTFCTESGTEADISHPIADSDVVDATQSVLPVEARITPMLHQKSTAESIVKNLRQGVTTVVLGDPLGAGKTYEAIMTYLYLRQLNPDLGMVVTVPDVVIDDWLQALTNMGLNHLTCQSIMTPKEVFDIDLNNMPAILFVKQSITLSLGLMTHQMVFAKLKVIYTLPRLHVFDEKTTVNKTITFLYECAKKNPRLILSGTVVTNSIQDIRHSFADAEQIGSSALENIMNDNSLFFCHYFRAGFFGIHPATPGNVFLNFLNLSAFLHNAFYSRMLSSLPFKSPLSRVKFLSIDVNSTSDDSVVAEVRDAPTMLLSGIGTTVKGDDATNRAFLDSHKERWYSAKLHRLVAEFSTPRASSEPCDILVVTASGDTSAKLVNSLTLFTTAAQYTCILIHSKHREKEINAARDAGLSIIFITESNRVEGFNIQRYLAKIIFFDAVRDAGDYTQAVGRGVRMGNQSELVEIKQYCTRSTVDYVEKRIATTRKAKHLLELIHADPAAIFLLLTQDVLIRHSGSLRKGVTFAYIFSGIKGVLLHFSSKLCKIINTPFKNTEQVMIDLIGLLTTVKGAEFDLEAWRSKYHPRKLNNPIVHTFVFEEEIVRFAFDKTSFTIFDSIRLIMANAKKHFHYAIASYDLVTLIQPHYLNLAYGFNVVNEYLLSLQRHLSSAQIQTLDSFDKMAVVLTICYSLTPGVFSGQSGIQAILLPYLKAKGFFNKTLFQCWIEKPYFLFAYVDAHIDSAETDEQLIEWLADMVVNAPVQAYQILCQLSAYRQQYTQALLVHVFPRLYNRLERAADNQPKEVYGNESYDILAEYFGQRSAWVQRILTAAQTAEITGLPLLHSDVVKRCKSLVKKCPKAERSELDRLLVEVSNMVSAKLSAEKSEAVPVKRAAEDVDGESMAFELFSQGERAKRRLTDVLRHTMFGASNDTSQGEEMHASRGQALVAVPDASSKPTPLSSPRFFNSSEPLPVPAAVKPSHAI